MNLRTHRIHLLALALTLSAGIHAALVPEHLKEMPPLGYSFIAASVGGVMIAWALLSAPDERPVVLVAVLFLVGEILAWALFVTVHVPGFSGTPEPVETIALITKAVEVFGIAAAAPLVSGRSVAQPV